MSMMKPCALALPVTLAMIAIKTSMNVPTDLTNVSLTPLVTTLKEATSAHAPRVTRATVAPAVQLVLVS